MTENVWAQMEDQKLNVVFILADDLGWTDLSGYGSVLHETPNIDRFASKNMKFTNAYAAAPICTPTRASILTGKYPARLHMTTWYENSGPPKPNDENKLLPPTTIGNLPLDEVTIAEVFKDAGYFTAHVGKWHLGDAAHFPQTQGFDINIGGTHWGAPATYWAPFRGRVKDQGKVQIRYIPDLKALDNKQIKGERAYLTDRLTDKAIEIIEEKKDEPFFLNMWYHSVHTPIEGKPELVKYYRKKVKPGMKDQNYIYAAMVASLDQNVGRLLKTIDEAGIADRTVVVFFSDNGGRVGEYYDWETVANNYPLRSGKGSLYEGGIRVPLIIGWPSVTKPGSVSDYPVISTDFYPTLLEITGLEGVKHHTAAIDGVSLVPLLKNPSADLDRESLYWHSPHYYSTTSPVSALRKGKWKLLQYFEDGHLELYNLKEDIGQHHNLAKEFRDMARVLYQELKNWRNRVGARLPSLNPQYKPRDW